jgi:DtxR family Mn-dependent transcriptional regulator
VKTEAKARARKPAAAGISLPVQSATIGRYLEAIFYIHAEGEAVRAARLAEWVGVAQPTTSAALHRMVRDGLVRITSANLVTLTPRGEAAAAAIVRRHRIAERWLTDVLGLDWVRADEEAGRLEHALSDDVADRLHKLIGEPVTCPHGNPIPGAKPLTRKERALSRLEPGRQSRVLRVSEVAEHEAPDLLGFLAETGFAIGTPVSVVSANRGAGILTARVNGRDIPMALDVADKIWVEERGAG